MRALLDLLRERLGTPVDVEFACDGDDLYLLQCRPQGSTLGDAPASIPVDLPVDGSSSPRIVMSRTATFPTSRT